MSAFTDNQIAELTAERDALRSHVVMVERFINHRPEYVKALKNTRGDDSKADYFRWTGHAEARRQLAEALGVKVPHELGERISLTAEVEQ